MPCDCRLNIFSIEARNTGLPYNEWAARGAGATLGTHSQPLVPCTGPSTEQEIPLAAKDWPVGDCWVTVRPTKGPLVPTRGIQGAFMETRHLSSRYLWPCCGSLANGAATLVSFRVTWQLHISCDHIFLTNPCSWGHSYAPYQSFRPCIFVLFMKTCI